jgi:hypothetical protein
MADTVYGLGQGFCEIVGAIAISFKQVKRDALCRLLADTGHTAKTVDQAYEQW